MAEPVWGEIQPIGGFQPSSSIEALDLGIWQPTWYNLAEDSESWLNVDQYLPGNEPAAEVSPGPGDGAQHKADVTCSYIWNLFLHMKPVPTYETCSSILNLFLDIKQTNTDVFSWEVLFPLPLTEQVL